MSDKRREILEVTRNPWVTVPRHIRINVDTGEVKIPDITSNRGPTGLPAEWTVRTKAGKSHRHVWIRAFTEQEAVASVLADFKRIDEERVERGQEALGWKDYNP